MKKLFKRQTWRHPIVLGILTGLMVVGGISLSIGIEPASSAKAAAQLPDPFAPCNPPAANAIACENSKTGNPESQWDIDGAGNDNIQGFATDISVNRGEVVRFKVDTNSNNYRLDIYRLGYYGGSGARLIETVQPSATLPQNQPDCLIQSSTGLVDCGNWEESASWAVPANATSGIYLAKLVREDTVSGSSHIVFIVRDDSGASDLLFQTSDTTWQAYNSYGGNSLYTGSPAGRAYKVSYNRPFNTRDGGTQHDWLFSNEYPMLRWLEANGYNVSYFTGIDTDRRGAELLEHEVFLSVGHDEYWSGTQRANVEAARNAGIHLTFFSGNIMFWKTRWENSIAGTSTPYRTLVCYKDTHANAKIDPLPNVWTGTWRDPRFSPPADGGRPENEVIGTVFMVNDPAEDDIRVPEALGKFRFWRNTTVATQTSGQTATVGPNTVGYEWDEDLDNGFRPIGLIRLSTNTVNVPSLLQDYGSEYDAGTATHSLTLYRHSSGALVFSAATIRWSWGLDNNHDQGGASTIPPPDVRMRQATVNLLADMGVQPATLQSGLVPASQSTDTLLPASTITSPTAGATVALGDSINITGTASDTGGGVVAAVSVSVDGGNTWKDATGRTSWSYSWTPTTAGSVTIRTRAIDDSGNIQNPPSTVTLTVGGSQPGTCCSLWGNGVTPGNTLENDGSAVELGLKFRADTNGSITGVRFYKGGAANGGTHVGHLWTSTGTLLGTTTFSGETTSGWQQALFPAPIAITANTTYVVSYLAPQGNYAADSGYFASAGVDNGPLHALSNAQGGGNGVYLYGSQGGFPTNTFASTNYWVDVVFSTATAGPDTTPPTVASFTPAAGSSNVSTGVNVTATFSEAMDASSVTGATIELRDSANALVPATVSYSAATLTATLDPTTSLTEGATYTALVRGGSTGVKDVAGNALVTDVTWSFTTAPPLPPGTTFSIWSPSTIPDNTIENDGSPLEVGLKFRSDNNGYITAVRFYKGGAANGGTHVGHLWTSTGTLLGTATFSGETTSGWQQALFPVPIAITANTTYVVSYLAPQGNYAADSGYFASAGVDNGPLHALSNAQGGGNGVYRYGSQGGFPTDTFSSGNYWVDVVFLDLGPSPPLVYSVTPAPGATNVSVGSAPAAVFSEALDSASVNTSTVLLRDAANNLIPVNITYAAGTFTVTLTPQQALAFGQTYTVTLKGGTAEPHITDATGVPLDSDYTWSFTTAPLLPILVITGSDNKFTQYYQEILRAEGFNNFNAIDLTQVTNTILAQYDVVILGEMALTSAQVTLLSNWVTAGGNLIAMRPDKQLSTLLGISDASSVRSDAYLLVNTTQEPGAGIVNQTIQYHSTADLYTLAGATQVATIYSSTTTATSNPAVTIRTVGVNGGQAAAFTFDLARSIVYTRQGNPAWAGQERDGGDPLVIRPNDLFFPNYVNLSKVAIPQADELQRLLGNMILFMNADKRPLARFWYFPNRKKAVIMMTGDDHGTDSGTESTFNSLISESAPGCSVDDWECYRATAWIYTNSGLTNSQALAYYNQGFDVGVHVNTGCADWTPQSLNSDFTDDLASFADKYTSLPAQKGNRTHCLAWSDWATQPKVELNHGIRLDETYYYWPSSWVLNRPGFMTGSGIPMRFADLDGTVIDVYQAATHLVNENGVNYPAGINTMLDRALGPEGYYGVFGTHYDYSDDFDVQLLESAMSRNVSLISAQQLLTWLDGRNSSSLGNPTWNGTQLGFSITVEPGAANLYAMIPNQTTGGLLSSLAINGVPVTFTVETIKGRSYAVFRASTGNVVATYAP